MLPMDPRLNRLRRIVFPFATIALIALFALPSSFSAQELAKRLFLKDGSYQLVTKYETKGDRVRYLSAERNEWEELPSSLVDWPATEKYEKNRAAGAAVPEAVELDKQVETELDAGEAALPQVAPGLRLPEDSGVFLLDTFQGQPQLIEVPQTAGDVNRNTKRNLLRGAINPVASAKQTVELEGEHATVQAHATVPALYIKLDEDLAAKQQLTKDQARGSQGQDTTRDGDQSEKGSNGSDRTAPQQPQQPQQPEQPIVPFERFRIVHAQVKGGKRIVGDIKVAVYGKVSQDQRFVKTTINHVTGGWLKLTPTEELAPGEYALVERVGKEGMNLYMWDFGVNPKAPANANAWKGETPAARSVPAIGNQTEQRK
jgi:hypothetical protein